MTLRASRFPRATPLALATVALFGLTAAVALPGKAASPHLSCGIVLNDHGGMVEIAAYVEADKQTYGTYAMKISQKGQRNSIRQEGDFEVLSGERAELGQAMLSGDAASVDVRLSVTADGHQTECSRL